MVTGVNTPQQQPVESPPPRGTQSTPGDAVAADQRRRLLAALPCAVAENGFDQTTVEDIVRLAQVRRSSFYEQFADKRECFATAYEIAQERLLGVLTYRCYTRSGPVERVGTALKAGLDLLATEPCVAHLTVIEAPSAGEAIATRHQEWLDRYGRLLQLAVVGTPDATKPRPALEPAIVGAIVSRIKQMVLSGEARNLRSLQPELTQLTLSFFDLAEPSTAALSSSGQREGVDSAQPQSPERSTVLEAA
jgi:AcrR family transcriptional regulator